MKTHDRVPQESYFCRRNTVTFLLKCIAQRVRERQLVLQELRRSFCFLTDDRAVFCSECIGLIGLASSYHYPHFCDCSLKEGQLTNKEPDTTVFKMFARHSNSSTEMPMQTGPPSAVSSRAAVIMISESGCNMKESKLHELRVAAEGN